MMARKPLDAGRAGGFGRRDPADARTFSNRQARQGKIILNTPFRRAIFVIGLVIAVIAAFSLAYLA